MGSGMLKSLKLVAPKSVTFIIRVFANNLGIDGTKNCFLYIISMHVPLSLHTLVGPQPEPLKMTKVFRMQNSGSTPLTVSMIGVGGGGCEEYGFSVTNCDKELVIKPNTTRRIEIA